MSTRRLVLLLMAVGAAFLPVPRWMVERWYSNGFYAVVQPAVTFTSNTTRFALLDVVWIGVTVAFLGLVARDLRRESRLRAAARIVTRAAIWSATLYLAFVVSWGLNYRRERLTERLPFDAGAVTPAAALRLASTSVDRVNGLHSTAHAEGWPAGATIDPSLAGAFDRVTAQLGAAARVVVGRPKHSLLDWYFRRAGVSGMTDPYFLETLVAGDLLPFERPSVIAHEWGHLAGIADEGEANAVGWFVCLQASPANQYSGWLFMYEEVIRVLPAQDRAALASRLGAGPRADLRAIRDRLAASVSPEISSAGWRVYDSYLKANRIEAGTRSYDEVLRLALGLELFQTY
jgi:Protein of unknown function (DUF3810)